MGTEEVYRYHALSMTSKFRASQKVSCRPLWATFLVPYSNLVLYNYLSTNLPVTKNTISRNRVNNTISRNRANNTISRNRAIIFKTISALLYQCTCTEPHRWSRSRANLYPKPLMRAHTQFRFVLNNICLLLCN